MGVASCSHVAPPVEEEVGVEAFGLEEDEITEIVPSNLVADKKVFDFAKPKPIVDTETASTVIPVPEGDILATAWSIRLDKSLDYFSPGTGKRGKLKIPSDVKHRRRMLTSRMTRQVSDRSNATSRSLLSSERSSELFADRSRREDEAEVLARWASLTGKVLYHKVLALASVSNMVLDRVRVAKGLEGKRHSKSSASRIAHDVIHRAKRLAYRIKAEASDCYDMDWPANALPNEILSFLFNDQYADTLMILAKAAKKTLASQPSLAEASAPCRVVGDIHGQVRDLLLLLFSYVMPGDRIVGSAKAAMKGGPPMSYVFNGDFVDRGEHQLETIGLLLALKVAFPGQVWLVRGNHEDRNMNERYGFEDECNRHLGESTGKHLYELFEDAFDHLPIACLVEEHVLVLHGGIGKGDWDLNDLRNVKRPLRSEHLAAEENNWLRNILWSDPIPDDADDVLNDDDDDGRSECPEDVFGVHASPRNHYSVTFGWDVTKAFCARNGLGLIVRSHQCIRGGLGFSVMHDNLLMLVFSARDYEGMANDSSILLIRHCAPSVKSSNDKSAGATSDEAMEDPSVSQELSFELDSKEFSKESSVIEMPSIFESKHLIVRPQILTSFAKNPIRVSVKS